MASSYKLGVKSLILIDLGPHPSLEGAKVFFLREKI